MPSKRSVRTLALASFVVLALALTGCITGDGMASAFSREFSGDPSIVSMKLSSADNVAFSGGVGGTVELNDGLDSDTVADLSARMRAFGAEDANSDKPMRIDLVVDEWQFPVLTDPSANGELLDLVADYRADDRLVGGTVISDEHVNDVRNATVVAHDADDLRTLFTEVPRRFADAGLRPNRIVRTADGVAEFEGPAGERADAAFTLFDALRAELRLTAFTLSDDTLDITLAHEADLERAKEVAAAAVGGALDPLWASDLVTLFPGSRGDAARELLAQLDDDVRASITTAWTNDADLTLRVTSSAEVAPLVDAVSSLGESALQVCVLRADEEVCLDEG